jgi:hypothetical protein
MQRDSVAKILESSPAKKGTPQNELGGKIGTGITLSLANDAELVNTAVTSTADVPAHGADSVKDSDTVMAQRILQLIDRNCRQGLAIEMLTGALVAVPPPFSTTMLSIR